MVLVHIGFAAKVVNSREVVLHTLSAVVAADFFQPFHTETRQAAAVGCNDNVVVGGHHLEIPAVAPELADGRLRSTFAEEECGIFLLRIEMGRIDDPAEHILAVGSLDPTLFDLAHRNLVVEGFVLLGQLADAQAFSFGDEGEHLVGRAHGMTLHQHTAAEGEGLQERIVVVTMRQLVHFALEVGRIDMGAAVPYTSEVESFAIWGPAELIDAALEGFGDVGFAARLQIEHTEARAVALIAIALH